MLQENFEHYLNLSPTVFFQWSVNENWSVLYVSDNVVELLGYPKEAFLTLQIDYKDLIHHDDFDVVFQEMLELDKTANASFKHSPYRLFRKDKSIVWVEDFTRVVRDESGMPLYYFGYINDVTQLQTSNRHLVEYKALLDSNNIITMSDKQGNITHANDMFLQNSGYKLEEIIGKPHNILRHQDTPSSVFKGMWKQIQQKKQWKGIIKSKKKNGDPFYADVCIAPLLNEQGEIEKYIGIRHDVTKLIEATEALRAQAEKDNLTGLGNRFKLLQDIKKAHKPFLALFDIVRFGEINDFYGYKTGDKLIISFAQKLFSLTPKGCGLYRINADEFALVYDNIDEEAFIAKVQKIHFALNHEPLHVKEKVIIISAVTALSLEAKDELLSTADLAKNHAKNSHILFCKYTKEIELAKEYELNIFWASKIKKALDEDKITTFFQPIFNNVTQKIEKYEALVRIVDEDGVISPFSFLDIAKRTHQYLEITKRVIRKSFEVFEKNDLDFSINLTREDILSDELKPYLWASVHEYNVQKRLILEIVESEGIKDIDAISEFLNKAKNCGCRLAIDDFGTGYSNFEYLIKLDATYIKIDGSIIKNIHKEDGAMDVIKAIVTFAKARGMKTVAEFVSSKEIFDSVCALGIDYSQGYYIGEPKPQIVIP